MMPVLYLWFFVVAFGSIWLGFLEVVWMDRHGVAWNDPAVFPGYIQFTGGLILFVLAGMLP